MRLLSDINVGDVYKTKGVALGYADRCIVIHYCKKNGTVHYFIENGSQRARMLTDSIFLIKFDRISKNEG